MPRHHDQREVPYTPAQMFALVADIERYPEFIPWCKALRITNSNINNGAGELYADMVVAYKVFREKFSCKVYLNPQDNTIAAHYIDGPMKNLTNQWKFLDNGKGGTFIDFTIEFEFKNFLLQAAAQQVFDKAFSRMSGAFVGRAEALYGRSGESLA